MIDHYRDQVMKGIGGKAKAMIVANGRANAVRYFLKTQSYLAENGSPFKVLVAFTGTVKLEETRARSTLSPISMALLKLKLQTNSKTMNIVFLSWQISTRLDLINLCCKACMSIES